LKTSGWVSAANANASQALPTHAEGASKAERPGRVPP